MPELYDRREFFKKVGIGTLGVLGAMVLPSLEAADQSKPKHNVTRDFLEVLDQHKEVFSANSIEGYTGRIFVRARQEDGLTYIFQMPGGSASSLVEDLPKGEFVLNVVDYRVYGKGRGGRLVDTNLDGKVNHYYGNPTDINIPVDISKLSPKTGYAQQQLFQRGVELLEQRITSGELVWPF